MWSNKHTVADSSVTLYFCIRPCSQCRDEDTDYFRDVQSSQEVLSCPSRSAVENASAPALGYHCSDPYSID